MLLSDNDLRNFLIKSVNNGDCSRGFANELLKWCGIKLITKSFNFTVDYKYCRIMGGVVDAVDAEAAKETIQEFIDNSEITITTTLKIERQAEFDAVEITDTDDDAVIEEDNLYGMDCSIEIWEV